MPAKRKPQYRIIKLKLDPHTTAPIMNLSELSGVRPESVIAVLLAIQTLRMGPLIAAMKREARRK